MKKKIAGFGPDLKKTRLGFGPVKKQKTKKNMKSGSRPVFEKKIVDFFAFLLSNYFYLNVIFSGFLPESHKGAAVGGDDANH